MHQIIRAAALCAALIAGTGSVAAGLKPSTSHGRSPTPSRFETNLRALASDDFSGREAGTEGYARAAFYVAERFRELGLKPAGEHGYFQQVSNRKSDVSKGDTKASLSIGGIERELVYGSDFFARPSLRDAEVTSSGDLVFAGYGLNDPELGINSYDGIDVRGKIVVVTTGPLTRSVKDSRLQSQYSYLQAAKEAARRGAIGLIDLRDGGDLRQQGVLGAEDALGDLKFIAFIDYKRTADLFQRAGISTALLKEIQLPNGRNVPMPRSRDLDARLKVKIVSKFIDQLGANHNVVGVLPGSDPRLKPEFVVLSAHLDGKGIADVSPTTSDRIRNGALDNAAGVAALLDVAASLSRRSMRPKRSVVFIAFASEELGLYGSNYFITNPTVPAGKIVANVNMDMPVLLYDFTDIVAYGAELSDLQADVASVARRNRVALSGDPDPKEKMFERSDQYNFIRAGIPSIFLSLGYANGGEKATKDYYAHNYHGRTDDLSLPIRYKQGVRFATIAAEVVKKIADRNDRPRWKPDAFYGRYCAPGPDLCASIY